MDFISIVSILNYMVIEEIINLLYCLLIGNPTNSVIIKAGIDASERNLLAKEPNHPIPLCFSFLICKASEFCIIPCMAQKLAAVRALARAFAVLLCAEITMPQIRVIEPAFLLAFFDLLFDIIVLFTGIEVTERLILIPDPTMLKAAHLSIDLLSPESIEAPFSSIIL